MMSPKFIKIQVPVTASPTLFPRCEGDGHVTTEEQLVWIRSVFDLLSDQIQIEGGELKLPNAKWVWDPAAPYPTYVFDRVRGKHGQPPSWKMRLLTLGDTMSFRAASLITVFVGFCGAIAVCWAMFSLLRPTLLSTIRDKNMFNTASYKLIHTPDGQSWTLVGTYVQWPIQGVLLRWNQRTTTEPLMDHISFTARPWPLNPQDKEVKVPKIVISRLPRHPQLPDQQVFIFVQTPEKRVAKIHNDLFDTQLEAVAALQATGDSLVVGKSYQFKITAYKDDKSTEIVESSSWSRPTMIQNKRAFTEYPLLLWKSFCGVIPDDTLGYFISKHCIVGDAPSLQVTFTDTKLAVVNDAPLFGAIDDGYGAQMGRYVQVSASTDTGSYEYTHKAILPQTRDKLVKWNQLVPHQGSGSIGLENADFLLVVFKPKAICLTMTPGNLDSEITLQAQPSTDVAEAEDRASLSMSWRQLLMICSHLDNDGITGELILRDGLTPCAVFQAKVALSNTILSKTNPPSGHLLRNIIPGFTYIWGEKITLTWPKDDSPVHYVDFVLVSEYLSREGGSTAKSGALAAYDQKFLKNERVITGMLAVNSQKHAIVVAPHLPPQVQRMKCYLEARNSNNASEVVSRSGDFVVIRPVELAEIELAYATFCTRNSIPMQTVTYGGIGAYGVITVTKQMHICTGYRRLLPLPAEAGMFPGTMPFEKESGQPLVEWAPAQIIVDGNTLEVPEKVKKEPPKKKPQTPRGDENGNKGTLVEPLLESGEKEDPAPTTRTITHSTEEIILPVNIFWKYEVDFLPEVLLWYALLPGWAREGWLSAFIVSLGQPIARIAPLFNRVDDVTRWTLTILMYLIQISLLALPTWMVSAFWIWHDTLMARVNPDVRPIASKNQEFLVDYIFSPSVFAWSRLRPYGKVLYLASWGYLLVVALTTFYCNFVAASRYHSDYIFKLVNQTMEFFVALFGFLVIVYVVIVAVWCLMGALIDPEALLPYAIMIIAVIGVTKLAWGKLIEMKNYVEGKIMGELDNALEALMCIFSDHKADASDADIAAVALKFKQNADAIVALMEGAEKDVMGELRNASTIDGEVEGEDMEKINLLRKGNAPPTDKVLCTDFVDPAILPKAQEIANDEATIGGTRKAASPMGVVPDNAITYGALGKAVAKMGNATLKKPGEFSSDEASFITQLAGSLSLSESCCRQTCSAYSHLLYQASAQNDAENQIMNPGAIAPMMTRIRRQQLFKHFSTYEENGAKTSDAIKLVKEMFNKELAGMEPIVATVLTKILDWTNVSRLSSKWVNGTLKPVIMMRQIEHQLDPVSNGTAACELTLKSFGEVHSTMTTGAGTTPFSKFDAIYSRDPLQAFVDCGIIDSQMKQSPQTKAIVNAAVDAQRAFDGSLAPEALITAMQTMCIPPASGSAAVKEDATGVTVYYLWFEGLQKMLKGLGFTPEEMDKVWLRRQWMIITDQKGLLQYRDISELNGALATLTDGGLWKAAMKALMLYVRIGGFVSCDPSKMSIEKCGDLARKVACSDWEDFRNIGKLCAWPDYVEGTWERLAASVDLRKGAVQIGPKFLRTAMIENFIEALVYLPVDDNTAKMMKFTPLNAYPTDGSDLQWQYGTDNAVWHLVGKRTPKRLRGMWLELFLDICEIMDCIPSDVDIYYQGLDWQSKNTERQSPWLRLETLKTWLRTTYVTDITSCTANQFSTLMTTYLGIDIDPATCVSQIFTKCPTIPGDDQGELRKLSDLGFATALFLGYL
eukprot:gnl/MRDRNA2_/MRDRNA2_36583_c0_seq1.p1 gnl/MRDRNA2_/MRDRNA2_36583_c0~~gnl/MRDRNA2_/MRDRNA2_36583_c0_seq1.p1  ORF type:complete len:1783 (+),score=289.00 gnl/MRDRNA2_/MRDRNA2_36583_c0_seq1:102-5351(+)